MARSRRLLVVILAVGLTVSACMPNLLPATPLPPSPLPPTGTPLPSPVQPTVAPCSVVATRTPPPEAPTLVPAQPGDPVRYVDPHIEICARPMAIKTGDVVSVVGRPVDIGLPVYALVVQDPGAADPVRLVEVTYGNEVRPTGESSTLLELVSAQGDLDQAVFVLRALASGTVRLRIVATGEIHYGYPGPAMWAGGGSDDIQLEISQP